MPHVMTQRRTRLARCSSQRCRVHPYWRAYDRGLCVECLDQFPALALVLAGFTTEELENIRLAIRLDVSLDTEGSR